MGPLTLRVIGHGRDSHQTPHFDPGGKHPVEGGREVLGQDPGFLRLAPGVHLDQDRRGKPASLGPGCRQRVAIHRMEEVGDGPHQTGLVRLERPYEVPADVPGEGSGLLGHLLGPVLPEVAVPLVVDSLDLDDGLLLRDRDDRHRQRITPDPFGRGGGAGDDLRIAHRSQATVAWRSRVRL
jgi:hypothetical protein